MNQGVSVAASGRGLVGNGVLGFGCKRSVYPSWIFTGWMGEGGSRQAVRRLGLFGLGCRWSRGAGARPAPPGPGSRAPRDQRRSPAASVPAQPAPHPTPPLTRRAETRARGGGPRGGWGGGAAPTLEGTRGKGGRGRGARGGGGAPGARGRGGPSLPARCSRRRSEAALSPQRD